MNSLSFRRDFYNKWSSNPNLIEFQLKNLVDRIELIREAQQSITERSPTPPSPNSVTEIDSSIGKSVEKKVKFGELVRLTLIPHFKEFKETEGETAPTVFEDLYYSKSELATIGAPPQLENRLEMYNDLLDTGIGDLKRKGLENLKSHLECLVEKIELLLKSNPKKEKALQRAKNCLGNYYLFLKLSGIVFARKNAIQIQINELTDQISNLTENRSPNNIHSENSLEEKIDLMKISLDDLKFEQTKINQGEVDHLFSSKYLKNIRELLGPALDGIKEILTLGDLPEEVRDVLTLGEKILKPKGILKAP